MSDERQRLGQRGEDAVARVLESRGWEIVGRNVRVGRLEIDLVAKRGQVVAFCEVRTRRTDAFGAPVETIDRAKVTRLRRAAATWIAQQGWRGVTLRFDAAGVVLGGEGPPKVTYYVDAF